MTTTVMRDLRQYLSEHAGAVWELPAGLSRVQVVTALQHRLDDAGLHPMLMARGTVDAIGRHGTIPVITNLTASRALVAAALGMPDHRQAASWFAQRSAAGIDPVVVSRHDAPVQQLVLEGDEADLAALPVLTQHELEPGPYLTAAHATTYDPDSGIDNTAIQRCWVQGARTMSWFPYPASHNARNLRKFWQRGEACPVAFWIGHHPAVLLGSQAKLGYPESHWRATGGVIGEPLRLVPSSTHGERLRVPADAEIVIEGFAQPGQTTADGPFGEYTGYLGPQTVAAQVGVTRITMRREAIYHDYGSGLTDMLVPDNMVMEGKLHSIVKAIAPSLRNVHVPASGRRFHAYLQLEEPQPGEARDALMAALSYRRVKFVMAVDEDIDLFSPASLDWAMATRVQWSRDSIVVDRLSGSSLDPSMPHGSSTASKMGVDATLPVRARAGAPRPVPPVARVTEAARRIADELDLPPHSSGWPRT